MTACALVALINAGGYTQAPIHFCVVLKQQLYEPNEATYRTVRGEANTPKAPADVTEDLS
jgi:hypothetical protein